MNAKLKKKILGWGIWVVAGGILYWIGTERFHLKHHSSFLVAFVVLVGVMLVAFMVLERKYGNSDPPQGPEG